LSKSCLLNFNEIWAFKEIFLEISLLTRPINIG
jgi:hypothetical protein